jgi:hypothetical protein
MQASSAAHLRRITSRDMAVRRDMCLLQSVRLLIRAVPARPRYASPAPHLLTLVVSHLRCPWQADAGRLFPSHYMPNFPVCYWIAGMFRAILAQRFFAFRAKLTTTRYKKLQHRGDLVLLWMNESICITITPVRMVW